MSLVVLELVGKMVFNFITSKKPRRVKIPQGHFNIIQPLIVTCRIFGLCPVYYQKTGTFYMLEWSLLYTLYSYILIITTSSFAILTLVEDMSLDEKSFRLKDIKSRLITTIDISIVILIALICTGGSLFRIKLFWKLLSCFNKIDNIIPLPKSNKHRNTSIVIISFVLVTFAGIEIFDVIMWEYINKHLGRQYIKAYIWFYILYYIVIVQEVFFSHLIYFIKIRISAINEYLDAEKCQQEKIWYTSADKFLVNCEINKPVFRKKGFLGAKFNSVERIVTLTRLYQIINTAVDSVNNSATTGILLIILSCLGHLVVTTYSLLKEVTKNGITIFSCLQMVWLATHAFRLLIIIEPCQACLKKIQHTTLLVMDLLAMHNIEEDIKNALVIFVMQLSKNKIKFSCCGLFKINRSIITSIAGTITTYLVILFQLNN